MQVGSNLTHLTLHFNRHTLWLLSFRAHDAKWSVFSRSREVYNSDFIITFPGLDLSKEKLCSWLHNQIEQRPLIKYPFLLKELPKNGIYFFYQDNEFWGHGGEKPRIVRIGTHKSNNFQSRINEHYLISKNWMDFNALKPAPKDRSIFRKNIGRAIINKENPKYLKIWNIDFTITKNRQKYSYLRNIKYEKEIEKKINKILRNTFSFRYIEIIKEENRIGSKGLESRLIGTISKCPVCKPSSEWLGKSSPIAKIRNSGLWQVQHLNSSPIDDKDEIFIRTCASSRS